MPQILTRGGLFTDMADNDSIYSILKLIHTELVKINRYLEIITDEKITSQDIMDEGEA